MTLTREQITAMLAANKHTQYAIASVTTNEVVNLCTLALEALELRAEHSDPATALARMWTAAIKEELEQYKAAHAKLRAENERLRAALQGLIDANENEWHPMKTNGAEWFTARAALERKPE